MPDDKLTNVPGVSKDTGMTDTTKRKIGLPGLHARAANASQKEKERSVDAATLPNRIGLMLDCSGSMHGEKIKLLQQAYDGFTTACDMSTTAIAVCCFPTSATDDENPFPQSRNTAADLPLTNNAGIIMLHGMGFKAAGGTPMAEAMGRMLHSNPITHGIIISDGEADNSDAALAECENYGASETPVDCVHIGDSHGGVELLKEIARRTGGIYMKFTDVASFAKSFEFLTPGKRNLLLSGAVNALDIGATEINK